MKRLFLLALIIMPIIGYRCCNRPAVICPVGIQSLICKYHKGRYWGGFCHEFSDLCVIRNWQMRDDLVRQMASRFIWHNPCELKMLIRRYLPAEDQVLRWHIAQYLPKRQQEALNSTWYEIQNPDLALPNPIRIPRVYRLVHEWRQAHMESDQGRQIFIVEQIAPYFENKTVDFIAPLIEVCFTKDDLILAYAISQYLDCYELYMFETVWNYIMMHRQHKTALHHNVYIPTSDERDEQAQQHERLKEYERRKINKLMDDFNSNKYQPTHPETLRLISPTA